MSGALFDTALTWSGYHLLGALSQGVVPGRMGTELPMIAPYGTFPASDGPVMISVGNDRLFGAICEALDLPDLAGDPRLATNAGRVAHRDLVNARIREVTATFTVDGLLARLRAAGVPAAPVKDVGQLLDDEQFRASDMMPADDEGRIYGALPLRWDGARAGASGQLPDPERDALEVLSELDLDDTTRSAVLRGQGTAT